MFVANIILAVVNIPLAGGLVRVLAIPPKVLYPIVLGLAFVGCYAISSSIIDFYILIILGVAGIIMKNAKIPTAPMILAVIVSGTMEQSFRQAFRLSNQDFSIFYSSTISQALIVITVISIALPVISMFRQRKPSLP